MIRIANSHCINLGTLVNKIIAPELNKVYILQSASYGGNRFYDGAKALNGSDRGSKEMVSALESLTTRNDMDRLTFIPWENVITRRNLLKNSLSWCAECLRSFEEPYFPLLWSIQTVKFCTIHGKLLINRCSCCKKCIPILHRRSTNKKCPYCDEELCQLKQNCEEKLIQDSKKEIFFVENTRELIEIVEYLEYRIERELIAHRIEYFNQFFRLNFCISLKDALGIPSSTFYCWLRGDAIPTLENLLDFCYSLGITIIEFFFHKNVRPSLPDKEINNSTNNKSKRRSLNREELTEKLKHYLTIEKPVSMEEVARQLDVAKRTLYRTFPDLCKAISSRYMESIKNKGTIRKVQIQSLIKETVVELKENGLKPTQKNIEKYLSLNSLLREDFAKKYLNELLEEL